MAAKVWMGWCAALAAAIGVGPLLIEPGDPTLHAARDEISRMSESQRGVLQRQYEQYQALSEADRAKLREMYRLLEADRTQNGLHVAALQDYCDWLKLIDAWEQDELVHQTDPQAKIKRVSEIVETRRVRTVSEAADGDQDERPGSQWMPPLLSEYELTKVFDVWSRRLTNLTLEEQAEIDKRHGLERFGTQIRHLKKTVGLGKSDALLMSISDAEFKEMAEATGNKEFLEKAETLRDPLNKRRYATMCIIASCVEQFHREGAATTDAEIMAYFQTLSPEKQDELLQLGASDFKTQLRLQRLEKHPEIVELQSLSPNFSAAMQMLKRFKSGGPMIRPGEDGGPPFGLPRDRNGEPRFEPRRESDRPGRGQRPPFRPGERNGDADFRSPAENRDGPPRRPPEENSEQAKPPTEKSPI